MTCQRQSILSRRMPAASISNGGLQEARVTAGAARALFGGDGGRAGDVARGGSGSAFGADATGDTGRAGALAAAVLFAAAARGRVRAVRTSGGGAAAVVEVPRESLTLAR